MNIADLEYRMYGLVPYNISDIQKGIQFGHAVVEYMMKYPSDDTVLNRTGKWASDDKTFIILNGGTTSDIRLQDAILKEGEPSMYYKGSLNNHLETLRYYGIDVATFYEPDLGNQLTAVVFLVDERVWNRKKYPDYPVDSGVLKNIGKYESRQYKNWRFNFSNNREEQDKIIFLREFLKQFKLA